MKVQVSTDKRVDGSTAIVSEVTTMVESSLARYRERLTRVEVHLSDVNGPKGGVDHRCALEARPAGLDAVAVTHNAQTPFEAAKGAVEKMLRLLTSTFGRHDDIKGLSASGQPT
ncbi:HPF/RaiA family ribosome-associated protein [Schlesneria paludicola]|uniref:HPF/RaiA family ribosome-associated protein n=1 Tax=Schlesneria paludicola TaxID=360056 RepID=UPI00029B3013|nr:HPF/RaiA family ribosome-associated protein [Schlesneria paludicola]